MQKWHAKPSEATLDGQMATTRKIRRRIDGDIEREITRLARYEGWTPAQIHRELNRRENCKGRVPELRTVQRIVAPIVSKESSVWLLADADPDDAALVLPVLAELIRHTQGRVSRLPQEIAEWIVRLRRAAPDMPVAWSLEVAFTCSDHARRDEPLDGITEMLAFAPWRSAQERERYLKLMIKWHPEWFSVLEPDDPLPWGYFLGGLSWDALRDPNAAGLLAMFEAIEREDKEEQETSDD